MKRSRKQNGTRNKKEKAIREEEKSRGEIKRKKERWRETKKKGKVGEGERN